MNTIDKLLLNKDLSRREAEQLFYTLFKNKRVTEQHQKLPLVLLRKKGEHANELAGLVRTIRKLERPLKTPRVPFLVDGCGTGGDGKQTFNISTVSCLVAAGAGASVAKHGNRGITSRCGSSDLLESLGVKINAPTKAMMRSLKRNRIAYFHAPNYHPLFGKVQGARRALGCKKIASIFNLIGPLVNPTRLKRQAIGTFRRDFASVIGQALKQLGVNHVLVIWNHAGFDELTTSSSATVLEVKNGKVRRSRVSPRALGFQKAGISALRGGKPEQNQKIVLNLLNGKDKSARRDVVILNAAAILVASGKARQLRDGVKQARVSLDSRAALRALQGLKGVSRGA